MNNEIESLVHLLISYMKHFTNHFEFMHLIEYYLTHKNNNYIHTLCSFIMYEYILFDEQIMCIAKSIILVSEKYSDTTYICNHHLEQFISDFLNTYLHIHVKKSNVISFLFPDIYPASILYLNNIYSNDSLLDVLKFIYVKNLQIMNL